MPWNISCVSYLSIPRLCRFTSTACAQERVARVCHVRGFVKYSTIVAAVVAIREKLISHAASGELEGCCCCCCSLLVIDIVTMVTAVTKIALAIIKAREEKDGPPIALSKRYILNTLSNAQNSNHNEVNADYFCFMSFYMSCSGRLLLQVSGYLHYYMLYEFCMGTTGFPLQIKFLGGNDRRVSVATSNAKESGYDVRLRK